jgi:hypothetical protein
VLIVVFWVVMPYGLLKMEMIHSSETLVTTYKTTLHHNPEDHEQQCDCHESLKSWKNVFIPNQATSTIQQNLTLFGVTNTG